MYIVPALNCTSFLSIYCRGEETVHITLIDHICVQGLMDQVMDQTTIITHPRLTYHTVAILLLLSSN